MNCRISRTNATNARFEAATQAVTLRAAEQRCVVLQGPAGSGKTSTLLAWRRELTGINFGVAWLSLSAEDTEAVRFSHCLLASLAEIDPGMVCEASTAAKTRAT